MFSSARQEPDPLEDRLRSAEAITSELMSAGIAAACPHFCALPAAARAKVNWLIQAGAWTDVAFALVKTELPRWQVRQLSQRGGQWICSLSEESDCQEGHYDIAEASHQLLPVAILRALLRVNRAATSARESRLATQCDGSGPKVQLRPACQSG
jgi:hypothetical protein